jgi:hypothetical protein
MDAGTTWIMGYFVCVYILRWQTNASATIAVAKLRKSLGYDT